MLMNVTLPLEIKMIIECWIINVSGCMLMKEIKLVFFAIVFFQDFENFENNAKTKLILLVHGKFIQFELSLKTKNIRLKLRCYAAANSMKSVKNIKNLVIGNTITSKTILTNVFFASNKCTTTTIPMCPDKSLNRA